MPIPVAKIMLLPVHERENIFQYAKVNGAWKAAEAHHEELKVAKQTLYVWLCNNIPESRPEGWQSPNKKKREKSDKPKERRLTTNEKEFLERLKNGEATIEETGRIVAVRVFENMLKNPDQFKYLDFYRSEFLKIKKDETAIKETWAKEVIAKMFAGKLPPSKCPHCGRSLMESKIQEAEIIPDESRELPASI